MDCYWEYSSTRLFSNTEKAMNEVSRDVCLEACSWNNRCQGVDWTNGNCYFATRKEVDQTRENPRDSRKNETGMYKKVACAPPGYEKPEAPQPPPPPPVPQPILVKERASFRFIEYWKVIGTVAKNDPFACQERVKTESACKLGFFTYAAKTGKCIC